MNPAPPIHRRSLLARLLTLLTGLGAALLLTLLLAANIGAQPVPLGVIADSVRRFFSGGPAGPQSYLATIFWDLRLPRVALGASAAILFHAGNLAGGVAKCLIAFMAGAGTMAIVLWLSRSRRVIQRDAFILAGVVVGSFMWALVTMVMSLAGGDLQTIVHWLMGNLSAEVNWSVVGVAAALVAIGCLGLYSHARDLNLLSLGEEQAQQLGVETEGVKIRVILYSALVTAAAVSVSGIIGFVGLVVPHVARKLVGPDHRLLLPAAGLLGAAFLVWADTLARGIGESFPVGVLTSLLGAPFFFYLLKRRPRPV